jgi:AAA domain
MTGPEYEAIMRSPLIEAKRQKIENIFVQHTKAEEAREMLRLSLWSSGGAWRNSSAYLIGWSRCGKSEILKRLLKEETGKKVTKAKVQLLEGHGKRYIYVDLMGGATPRTLARKINFDIFNDRKSLSLGEDDGVEALIHNVNDHHVGGVILDEAGNMADDKAGIKKLGRLILSFENQCNAPLILIGDPSLEDMRNTVKATKQRSGGIKKLQPFAFASDEYAAFVSAFSDQLPFPKNWFKENEDDHDMLRATFYAQRGRPGRHALLAVASTVHAFIRTGGAEPDELTKEDVAAAFDRVSRDDKEMHGLNPFREDDYRRLPEFPLSVDQEENPD